MRQLVRGTLVGVLAGIAGVAARPPGPPERVPRYAPLQLECARFRQLSRSSLETYVAGRARTETFGLDGEWRFRATPGRADSLQLEAWFDTLSIWRRAPDGALEPETDAVIGGRYRGVLSADGGYRAGVRPFIPDEVAEVADLSRALDDLLPRLPARALAVGATWADGAGLEIRRLGDSSGVDSVSRFRLTLRRETREGALQGDSIPLRLQQSTREDGTFAWHASRGLLRRERHITVETYVPVEPRVRRPVRSRVEQNVMLERLADGCEG